MRVIAVTNQKGGCGKTTICVNLAASLAEQRRGVLLVDMDPQSHCGVALSVPEERIEHSVADALLQDVGGAPVELDQAIWQIADGLEFLPSTRALSRLEISDSGGPDRDACLRSVLQSLSHRYDYCIIDCPPHAGVLARMAVSAADDVIIPVETGYFSLRGLDPHLEIVQEHIEQLDQQVRIHVLANGYDVRTKLAREILNELRRRYDHLMLKSYINFNTKLKEGASLGQPITEYDRGSMGYRDFARLAGELISMEQPAAVHEELLDQANRLAERAETLLATPQTLLAAANLARRQTTPTAERTGRAQAAPASSPKTTASHGRIQRKIDHIYGVRQTSEGVEFNIDLPGASDVLIAGDFNDWSPQRTPMIRHGDNGHFRAVVPLSKGRYRYRLVVDGRWTEDPCNEQMEVNDMGEVTSVVEIG